MLLACVADARTLRESFDRLQRDHRALVDKSSALEKSLLNEQRAKERAEQARLSAEQRLQDSKDRKTRDGLTAQVAQYQATVGPACVVLRGGRRACFCMRCCCGCVLLLALGSGPRCCVMTASCKTVSDARPYTLLYAHSTCARLLSKCW